MPEYQFNDVFIVDKLNKNFEKVTRIEARGERTHMKMQLDVATEIYKINVGEKFNVVLVSTLYLDGTPDTGRDFYYTQTPNLADNFEYVVRGRLYKISEDTSSPENAKLEIHASFGGLLMILKGDCPKDNTFELDQRLFLLMRKA